MRNSFGFDMMDSKKITLSTNDTKKLEERQKNRGNGETGKRGEIDLYSPALRFAVSSIPFLLAFLPLCLFVRQSCRFLFSWHNFYLRQYLRGFAALMCGKAPPFREHPISFLAATPPVSGVAAKTP